MTIETRSNRRRGRPPGSDADETRQRIVWAAREVFGEVGYAATTNMAVATRAQLTRPSINYHFQNKRELFRRVVDENAGILAATLRLAELETTLRARLRTIVTAVIRDSRVSAAVVFLMAAEIDCARNADLRSEGHQLFEGLREFLRSAVLDAVARDEVRADVQAAALVDAFFSVLSGMALHGGGMLGGGPLGEDSVDAVMLMLAGELFNEPNGI